MLDVLVSSGLEGLKRWPVRRTEVERVWPMVQFPVLPPPIYTCLCSLQGLKISVLWTLYYGVLSGFAPVYSWILVLRGLVGFGIGGVPQS